MCIINVTSPLILVFISANCVVCKVYNFKQMFISCKQVGIFSLHCLFYNMKFFQDCCGCEPCNHFHVKPYEHY
jgi:hypothetical protein